ncbi:perilipin-3-like [Lacerta agilis]|uniref:perilipin-3-like n=1 Tax=Lacerta agilis TaxID=80427 RepID=UPI00141A5F79|nr:perilipin-3-like [Lacerta agilis]
MATDVKGDGQEAPHTMNIVTRVTSLPLVSSTYDICHSLYNYAKENYPFINSACSVAEMVAAVAVGSAVGGAQPLLGHLEPQIAAVNQYACKGLDQLEETLPILHQPAHQVIEDGVTITKTVLSSTVNVAMDAASGAKQLWSNRVSEAVDLTKDIVQDSVNLTKSVVSSTVNTAVNAANEAKELVTHRVADVVNLSKETAQDSVELTKSVVNTALQAAQETRELVAGQVKTCGPVQEGIEMTSLLKQALSSGVDVMLGKTEDMVDYYLPMTDEELVKLATEVQGFGEASLEEQSKRQSYFVRLGSLSSKVRRRAYLHSLGKLHLVREKTQNTLSQLQLVINLVEAAQQGIGKRLQEAQEKLSQLLLEWTQAQPEERQAAAGGTQPEVESGTLAMLRFVTQDLRPVYAHLASTIEGLPSNIRERVAQSLGNLCQLHASFSSASSFQDLSSSLLAQSRNRIAQAQEALETLVEHVVQKTPLNWVVGPFRPSAGTEMETESQEMEMLAPEEPMDEAEAAVKSVKKKEKAESEGAKAAQALVAGSPLSGVARKAKKEINEGEEMKKKKKQPNKSTLNQISDAAEKQA